MFVYTFFLILPQSESNPLPKHGFWQNGRKRKGKALSALDEGGAIEAEIVDALIDVLVAAFDLVAIVDDAIAFGG